MSSRRCDGMFLLTELSGECGRIPFVTHISRKQPGWRRALIEKKNKTLSMYYFSCAINHSTLSQSKFLIQLIALPQPHRFDYNLQPLIYIRALYPRFISGRLACCFYINFLEFIQHEQNLFRSGSTLRQYTIFTKFLIVLKLGSTDLRCISE